MPQKVFEKNGWQCFSAHHNDTFVYQALKTLGKAVLFDGDPHKSAHSTLILTAEPAAELQLDDARSGSFTQHYQQAIPAELASLPFPCGFVGYASYDYGEDQLLGAGNNQSDFPISSLRYYGWSYTVDLATGEAVICFSPRTSAKLQRRVIDMLSAPTHPQPPHCDPTRTGWSLSSSRPHYTAAFNAIKEYILAGDCYQANLTQRFEGKLHQPIEDYYAQLRTSIHTPYCNFYALNDAQHILSFSPERFIKIENRRVTTAPIKGTTSKSTPNAKALLVDSTKNRAENLMIVDLLRNDLSKFCKPHSVNVPSLFAIEEYETVYHMVSTIQGELKDNISELQAFLSAFPGGSITGAPKKRAMEIIRDLECHKRSAYCGSIFYWSDHGNFDSNILIRTIVHNDGRLFTWAGGGIVSDSSCAEEYEESLVKVRNITQL